MDGNTRNRIISEGAEAKVYSANIFGRECIVKVRYSKSYRNSILDIGLRKSRTKRESKIMAKAASLGIKIPRIIASGEFSIYMEAIHGSMMKDSKYGKSFMSALGSELSKLHSAGISHGDFTPANVIICGSSFYIIDFGLSEITQSLDSMAIDLLLMKRSNPKHFSSFKRGYSLWKGAGEVLERLKKIEERGRYKTRTLSTA
jgi:Kae1-associated kinase Bud32